MIKVIKKGLIAGISLAFCISNAAFAHNNPHEHKCSLDTLDGLYEFNATGWALRNGVWQPKAIVEFIRLNGDGSGSADATVANRTGDGSISRSTSSPATYVINEDCSGTLQFADGPAFDIFTTLRGEAFQLIQTNPNNVLQGTARKIGR